MALTVSEMREKTKKKRSQAITGLINVIRTRDGSTSPPIEGQKQVDDFNMSMLFGSSQNENIQWDRMGVEGLIRLYYNIIQTIEGTTRNKLIVAGAVGGDASDKTGLQFAADSLIRGTYTNSAFFKSENNKPEFDVDNNIYTDNGSQSQEDFNNSLLHHLIEARSIIGSKSTLGLKESDIDNWQAHVRINEILGMRFTDVVPYVVFGTHEYNTEGEIIDTTYEYHYGDGIYDVDPLIQEPPGFVTSSMNNYWDSNVESHINIFKTKCLELKTWIQHSIIETEDYITNPNVIFGKNENFQIQQNWILEIDSVISACDSIITGIVPHKQSSTRTNVLYRESINNILEDFESSTRSFQTLCNNIINSLNGAFGDVNNSGSLRGLRFLWIKNILDPNDGSKVAVNGLQTAIDVMRGNITKAEGEFGLYGLTPSEWIPIPEIVGMQIYWLPNQETLELEPVGYILAWEGQDHVVGYNVERSDDWDGENGSWSLILPSGNSYSIQEIDANTGRALTYYIDNDVDITGGQKPFYRIKAFDTGGSGDMSRIATQSSTGDPKNIDDFPDEGETAFPIPGSPPPPPPVTIPEIPDTVPDGTLIWTTILTNIDAEDVDKTIYKSEVPFDSSGTNLVIYVNGELRNRGSDQDYVIEDYFTVKFNQSISDNDEVTMNVFIRNPDKDITSWKDPVDTFIQLPQQLNSDGDIRLVKENHALYQWSSNSWILISAAADGEAWGSPVDSISNLPASGSDGEVRFVISQQSFYYFNGSQNQWLNVASQSMRWKDPVNTVDLLPTDNNITGDVRLVITESKLYLWNGSNWTSIIADAGNITISHSDLADMPDLEGIIADHDARYYTENEIDITVTDLQSQINALLSLVPSDADELKGVFRWTGTIFRTGHLSYNSGSFVTLVPEQKFSRITTDPDFTLLNPETSQFNQADKGILRLYINDIEVDEFDLESEFNESLRDEGQNYTPKISNNGFITIMSVAPYANYPSYQKGEFRIHIEGTNLVPGENKIKLIHELYSGNQETDDFIFFWDNFTAQIGFQNIQIQHENISSTKYISGIRHYDIGDQLKIGFSSTRLFDNTYTMPNQVEIDPLTLGSNLHYINYQSPGSSGVDTPSVGKILQYENVVSVNTENIYSVNPRLRLAGYDPHSKHNNFYSPYRNILINTFPIISDDKNEYFVDEYYRLSEVNNYNTIPVNITGQWNSENILQNNQLQVYDSKIIYPTINYGSYLPTQTISYSGYTGQRVYIRAFRDVDPQNNGILFVENFNIDDENVKITIKLPSQTGWLDLSKQFNTADFNGSDGDGCLINRSGYDLQWTSGGFSTANSGYMIIVRVTILNSNAQPISKISLRNW